jgi:hypothetical protein
MHSADQGVAQNQFTLYTSQWNLSKSNAEKIGILYKPCPKEVGLHKFDCT